MRIRLVLTSVALLTLVACTSGQMSDAGSGNEPPVAGNPADGTLTISDAPVDLLPLTVRDALDAGDAAVLVSGSLFVDSEGGVLLCEAIAESFPPQCGGERLRVVGLDLEALDLEEANGVRWMESIDVAGTVN